MKSKGKIVPAVLVVVSLILVISVSAGCIDDVENFLSMELDNPLDLLMGDSGDINLGGVLSNKPISEVETEVEQYIYRFTNEQRTKYGLPALSYDSKLSAIAKAHSVDMATHGFFEHTNLKGQDPTARARAAGYNVHKNLTGGWYTDGISENISMMPHGNVSGVGYVGKYDSEKIAKEIVNLWMGSQGHRENILEKSSFKIGIGVSYDGKGNYYVTQDFW